jgi:hypothetical protein
VEESDHRHRLLRARAERPRSRRTTEQRDNLAAVHLITSSHPPFAERNLWNVARLVEPIAA